MLAKVPPPHAQQLADPPKGPLRPPLGRILKRLEAGPKFRKAARKEQKGTSKILRIQIGGFDGLMRFCSVFGLGGLEVVVAVE